MFVLQHRRFSTTRILGCAAALFAVVNTKTSPTERGNNCIERYSDAIAADLSRCVAELTRELESFDVGDAHVDRLHPEALVDVMPQLESNVSIDGESVTVDDHQNLSFTCRVECIRDALNCVSRCGSRHRKCRATFADRIIECLARSDSAD